MSAYRHVRPRFVAHAAALVRALALLLDKRDHSCTERRAAKEQPHANHDVAVEHHWRGSPETGGACARRLARHRERVDADAKESQQSLPHSRVQERARFCVKVLQDAREITSHAALRVGGGGVWVGWKDQR